jgi:hypothetical protein
MSIIHLASKVPLGFQILSILPLMTVFMKSMSILVYLLTKRIPPTSSARSVAMLPIHKGEVTLMAERVEERGEGCDHQVFSVKYFHTILQV